MNKSQKKIPIVYPKNWKNYELLDCGNYRKLERFGNVICDRPEPSANWNKMISAKKWLSADIVFQEQKAQKGKWIIHRSPSDKWTMDYELPNKRVTFLLEQTAFKHIGLFPEQAVNWDYIHKHCTRISQSGTIPKVLNLFAYTGAASVVANAAGAEVTHVDSIKQVVNWANNNAKLNNEENIRWIIEDAHKFVLRALKRGDKYNGIILDPPAFGHGPKGTSWKLEKDLTLLLRDVVKLLDRSNSFFILNTYSPQMSMEKLQTLLNSTQSFPKIYESKNLGIKSNSDKFLPLGNLIRFYS